MAFNPAPTGYFPGIVTSSSGVFIPYADLESYSVSTSGDIRQLIYSFNKAIDDTYQTLSSSGLPTEMTFSSSQGFIDNATIRKNFNVSFNLAFSGSYSVTDE